MQEVTTTVNGIETTLLLDDDEAKRVSEADSKSDESKTKARKSVDNKSAS